MLEEPMNNMDNIYVLPPQVFTAMKVIPVLWECQRQLFVYFLVLQKQYGHPTSTAVCILNAHT